MRKENSITGQAYRKINSYNVGETFTVSDIYNSGDLRCNSYYGPRQRLYDILTMLNKTGLINRVKRGTYMLMYPIPEALTSTDVEFYCGYARDFTYSTRKTTNRKENPFDIREYKASFIPNPPTEVRNDEIPMPHSSGNVVENTNPVTKTIYSVNPKTGEINQSQILKFDVSYKATPFVFDDIDSAEAFAEGLVVINIDDEDDGLDNALSEIESEIAEVLFEEGNPKSDPEYKSSVTEEQFEEAKKIITSPSYVDIILPVGTTVFVVTAKFPKISIAREVVEEIEIEIDKSGVNYEFECESGYEFKKNDLGVKVFESKEDAIATLVELV
jgi:hypothetical protein